MKPLLFLIVCYILFSCSSSTSSRRIQQIALQPIGHCDSAQLLFIQQQVHDFFHKPVVILPEKAMPAAFINTSKGERYSADSIINWLLPLAHDSISHVVGITHKDIFTTITDGHGQVKQPAYKYGVWGIFGLGYRPGKSAVISNYRLAANDMQKMQHRLRTVVIHEVGHNLGLPHCPEKHCIMNDANETIQTVDRSADDYCTRCRNRIKALW
jgi:archaemetzincin